MKASEVRNMSTDELKNKLKEETKELFNLRFQNATMQLENPSRIGEVKKTIARVKTVMNERRLGINQA